MADITIDTTKLSERGQVVIPKEVRDKMGLKKGSKLILIATDEAIVMQKIEFAGERLRALDLIQKARQIADRLGLK